MLLAIQILATVSIVLSLFNAADELDHVGAFVIALILIATLITFLWLWVLPGLVILLSTTLAAQLIKLANR